MRNWKSNIRKACALIEADPKAYWCDKTEKVGNIILRANVYSGEYRDFGTACYQIPLFRIMYKDEKGWIGNCSTVEGVISILQEKLEFRI